MVTRCTVLKPAARAKCLDCKTVIFFTWNSRKSPKTRTRDALGFSRPSPHARMTSQVALFIPCSLATFENRARSYFEPVPRIWSVFQFTHVFVRDARATGSDWETRKTTLWWLGSAMPWSKRSRTIGVFIVASLAHYGSGRDIKNIHGCWSTFLLVLQR